MHGSLPQAAEPNPVSLAGENDQVSELRRLRAENAKLEARLTDAHLINEFSLRLNVESDVQSVYEQLLASAVKIMRADFGTIQRFREHRGDGGELELLTHAGFPQNAADPWQWVRRTNVSTCGLSLTRRERTIFHDVEVSAAGTADLEGFRAAGIRAAQSTPLVTRSGKFIGMISTHWRTPHEPGVEELAHLDVIARQAADQIERRAYEEDIDHNLSAMTYLQDLGQVCVDPMTTFDGCIQKIVEAAVAVGRSDKAVLQLLHGDGTLRIAGHCGFDEPFLNFFERVDQSEASACAAVMRTGGRMEVSNVATSPIFGVGESRRVMLEAGVRAVQATALVSSNGKLLGMISTHYAAPSQLSARVRRLLELLSRQAADFLERKQYEVKLQEQANLIQTINDNTSELIFVKDVKGRLTYANAATLKTVGLQDLSGEDDLDSSLFSEPSEHEPIAENDRHVARTGETVRAEEPYTSPDGTHRVFLSTKTPLRDASGAIVGVVGVSHDITKEKEAERTRQLLVDELNHRAKNMLAMVQSIATQSMRRSPRPEHFVAAFSGRIQAMARAHTILTRTAWSNAELRDVIVDQVLMGSGDARVVLSGPPVLLAAQQVLQLALAFHELGTNARKYGALSREDGKLTVTWALHEAEHRELRIDWREEAPTALAKSDSKGGGFGSVLIQAIAASGKAEMIRTERGILWDIRMPLADTQQHRRSDPYGVIHEPLARPQTRVALEGRRVLVVEDEPLIGMEIGAVLESAKIDVVGPVTTVAAALKCIETSQIDAALLDMNIAGERIDAVAAALIRKNVPIAFLTGYGREKLPQEFSGATVLNKPFMPAQVLTTIEAILGPKEQSVVRLVSRRP